MRLKPTLFGLVGCALAIGGCAGSDTLTTSQTSQALESAQCTFQQDHAQAQACFDTYDACVAAANGDVQPCRDALLGCLPPPPPPRGGPGMGPPPPLPDGGLPPPPPGGGGDCGGMGPPPLLPDGGLPPPPPGGMGPPPGGGHGPGPGGPPPVQPDPAAVQACHDALDACLAATPGAPACFQAEHQCMQAAFAAAFDALCANVTCDPAIDPDCARLQQRCAEGVGGRPEAFDGGVCP